MAFRVKDLLINIAPGPGFDPGAGQHGRPCQGTFTFTRTGTVGNCTDTMQNCTGTLLNCTGTVPTHWISPFCCAYSLFPITTIFTMPPWCDPICAAEQLAVLKAQLKLALADIENREKQLEESLEPQTPAQIEELEVKLKEALTELRRRKSELKKK